MLMGVPETVPAPQWLRDIARRLKKRREDIAFEAGEPPRLLIRSEGADAADILRFFLGNEDMRRWLSRNPFSPRLAICLSDGPGAPRVVAAYEAFGVRLVSGTGPLEGEPPLRSPTGEDFAAWFIRTFAVWFPRPDLAAAMCFVRENLWSAPPLRPGQVSGLPYCLRAIGPRDYRLAGFWGCGGNGDAGYYTRVAGSVKLLLRAGHGGPFRDPDRTGEAFHREIDWAEEIARRAIAAGIPLVLRHGLDVVRLSIGDAEFAGRLDFTADGPVAREARENLDRCLAVLPG